MRYIALLLLTLATATLLYASPSFQSAPQTPSTPVKPIGTMSELMVKIIYPYSDAIFYVEREAPQNEAEWMALESKALTLAEMGNLLMAPPRARDQVQWMKDAQLLVDVGAAAYKGARARNLQAIIDLNADLYESCQSCHEHYRPGYRRRL